MVVTRRATDHQETPDGRHQATEWTRRVRRQAAHAPAPPPFRKGAIIIIIGALGPQWPHAKGRKQHSSCALVTPVGIKVRKYWARWRLRNRWGHGLSPLWRSSWRAMPPRRSMVRRQEHSPACRVGSGRMGATAAASAINSEAAGALSCTSCWVGQEGWRVTASAINGEAAGALPRVCAGPGRRDGGKVLPPRRSMVRRQNLSLTCPTDLLSPAGKVGGRPAPWACPWDPTAAGPEGGEHASRQCGCRAGPPAAHSGLVLWLQINPRLRAEPDGRAGGVARRRPEGRHPAPTPAHTAKNQSAPRAAAAPAAASGQLPQRLRLGAAQYLRPTWRQPLGHL